MKYQLHKAIMHRFKLKHVFDSARNSDAFNFNKKEELNLCARFSRRTKCEGCKLNFLNFLDNKVIFQQQ